MKVTMKKCRGNADEALIWILLGLVLLAGLWGYIQIKAFAAWLNVDMDTATSIVLRGGALVAALAVTLWIGKFLKVFTYSLSGVFLCSIPLLDYRATHPVADLIQTTDLAWYGAWWAQSGMFAALLVVGYVLAEWFDSH